MLAAYYHWIKLNYEKRGRTFILINLILELIFRKLKQLYERSLISGSRSVITVCRLFVNVMRTIACENIMEKPLINMLVQAVLKSNHFKDI